MSKNFFLSQCIGMLIGMTSNLPKCPGSSPFHQIIRNLNQGILQDSNSFSFDNRICRFLTIRSKIPESYNARQPRRIPIIIQKINDCRDTSRLDTNLGKFRTLLDNFPDNSGSSFPHPFIVIFETIQDFGEKLRPAHRLCQLCCVLSNVRQSLTHLFFQLCFMMIDLLGEVRHCSCIDDGLGEVSGVLADLVYCQGRDPLQVGIRFLKSQDQSRNTSWISNTLSQRFRMPTFHIPHT